VLNRSDIEDGIWPLVEAANATSYETVSSCEGHIDEKLAGIVFLAKNAAALKVQMALNRLLPHLQCHWDLSARYIMPRQTGGEWVLSWRLENCGIRTQIDDVDEWWQQTTEAGQTDVPRLAEMFRALD
jgi:hypothetical protein